MLIDSSSGRDPDSVSAGDGTVGLPVVTIPADLSLADIWRQPLPHQPDEPLTRMLCRWITAISRRYVREIDGSLDALAPEQDPFVLVLNHSQRLEAVLIPTLLLYYRGGKPIHFLADWNMLMVPLVGMLYRRGRNIIVTQKQAKPRFLNIFKPLFRQPAPAFQQALDRLRSGAPVGLFPEGTMNRNPHALLPGRPGAARLALTAGVPVLPVGIRFPGLRGPRIRDGAGMRLVIGQALQLPEPRRPGKPAREEVLDGHRRIMEQLSALSGKEWSPRTSERRSHVAEE